LFYLRMGCLWKRPKCQGMASSRGNQQGNDITNEEQIEIKQRIIIYRPTLEGKYYVMNYGTC